MVKVALTMTSLIGLIGCTSKPPDPAAQLPASASALAHHGEQVYRMMCISCHNLDPRKDGSIGPAVAGSSLELVEARVLRGSYPPGYKPKRETHQMPVYPQLATETAAIAAYLQSFQPLPVTTSTPTPAPGPTATK
jgi:mono/diheme cytochrome c family protein